MVVLHPSKITFGFNQAYFFVYFVAKLSQNDLPMSSGAETWSIWHLKLNEVVVVTRGFVDVVAAAVGVVGHVLAALEGAEVARVVLGREP
jgi:hypothetical protein